MESIVDTLEASLLAGDEPITQVAARLITDAPRDEREQTETIVELWLEERALERGLSVAAVSGAPFISDYVGVDA